MGPRHDGRGKMRGRRHGPRSIIGVQFDDGQGDLVDVDTPGFVFIGPFAAALHQNTSPARLNFGDYQVSLPRWRPTPTPELDEPLARVTDEGLHNNEAAGTGFFDQQDGFLRFLSIPVSARR